MKKTLIIMLALFAGAVISSHAAQYPVKNQVKTQMSFIADFDFFRVHRQAKNAVLTWGLNAEPGITYFVIERSYDGTYFDAIGSTAAVNARSYQWKDLAVFPGTIYYRIGCVMTDGSIVYSPVESVRIVVH